MKAYRIKFHGSGLLLKLDSQETECGFYVNEYVAARDEDSAIERGRRSLVKRLKTDSGIRLTPDTLASIVVEEVFPGNFWIKLLSREGLSLYRKTADGGAVQ